MIAAEHGDFAVRVWQSRLDAVVGGEIAWLSDEERQRAARFRRPSDRDAWLAAHVFLRRVLGRELGQAPEDLRFVEGSNGKPRLDGAPIAFNLSHCGEIALVAVSRAGEVGVDVERTRDGIDPIALARIGIGPAAAASLSELPHHARRPAFFRLWVRHEAAVKCMGTGLGTPQNALVEQPSVADIETEPGYVAAVAVRRAPARDCHRRERSLHWQNRLSKGVAACR